MCVLFYFYVFLIMFVVKGLSVLLVFATVRLYLNHNGSVSAAQTGLV